MKAVENLILTIILLLLLAPTPVYSAKNTLPVWIKNPPQQLNDTYYFKVVETDAGQTLTSARKYAQEALISSVERDFKVKVSDVLESESIITTHNDKTVYDEKESYKLKIETENLGVTLYYERVDEYYYTDGALFKLYTLYAVARPNEVNPHFDNFIKTDKYGVHGLWRSAVVPGWGQFYKGSKLKGGVMLGSTAAAVGVAIYADNKKTNYMRNMAESYGSDTKRYYADKADNMITVRNISIGAAVAMYTYSLIDAVVASGANRVIVTKRNGRNTSLTLVPLTTQEMNGASLVCKF